MPARTASPTPPPAGPKRTRAPKEARREQLIDATLATLERKGLAAITLADVAEEAGLSRGIVNFHFESKERLLFETLARLAAEYDANWRRELAAAGPDAAARLRALIAADFNDVVCTPRKVVAWFRFFGEATSRSEYQDLCWARDDAHLETIRALFETLDREEGYGLDADATAMMAFATLEGLWLQMMLGNAEMDRAGGMALALRLLGTLFPRHFAADGALLPRRSADDALSPRP